MSYRRYLYKGIDASGACISQFILARNPHHVRKMLASLHITPISVQRQYFNKTAEIKMTGRHLAQFTQSLADLLKAGLNISQALRALQTKKASAINNALQQIQHSLTMGHSFSQSLQQFPEYFSESYCRIVHAGEQSGTLALQLQQLAQHQQQILQIKQQLRKAAIYPVCVFVIAMIITVGLLLGVVPQFQQIYSDFNAPLPRLTAIVIASSRLLQEEGMLIFSSITAFALLIKLLLQHSPRFRQRWHAVLLKLPLLNKVIRYHCLAQWAHAVATTTAAGIPLLNAIETANSVISHAVVKQEFEQLAQHITRGESLQNALSTVSLFSETDLQLIATGENSGKLPEMLQKLAEHYQQALSDLLSNLSKSFEPVMMIFLAGIIGLLIAAMYLPVFQLGAVFS